MLPIFIDHFLTEYFVTNQDISFCSTIMKNVAISIFISISLYNTAKATCYPTGLCEDGFMDMTEGHYEQAVDCNTDCAGGPYYANLECECACITSEGCSSETAQSDGVLSDGEIAGIVIGSLVAAWILRCMKNVYCNKNLQPLVHEGRDVGLVQSHALQGRQTTSHRFH